MSAFVTDGPAWPDNALPLTGERTIPGLAEENYWFRRHEVVYQRLADRCAGRDVLEAGCGEGYGADLIADVARRVIGLDYDESAVAHVRARYPRVEMQHGNLAALPLPDAAVDVVVNFQVIEHLWDQGQFVAECLRVLRPGGVLLMSTPNRITFSPGRDTPINPFHTRELNAAELTELLHAAGFRIEGDATGCFTAARLAELDARHGGSIIDAQIARALADAPWPADLLADVASVTTDDFDLVEAADATTGTSMKASIWWRSRCGRDDAPSRYPGLFTLVLHTHLPWLAHHGRWPVGEEWLYQSWSAAYLPLMRVLRTLAAEDRHHLLTLGMTPVVTAQLDDPYCLSGMHHWLANWRLRALEATTLRDPLREFGVREHDRGRSRARRVRYAVAPRRQPAAA